ncbi:hypothetical protein FOA52_002927 [Chlamydomonas sp. UWO 241]|nr:hypothetical protein FOA52_002927 [Chlamydomonas sp. UWO 241]
MGVVEHGPRPGKPRRGVFAAVLITCCTVSLLVGFFVGNSGMPEIEVLGADSWSVGTLSASTPAVPAVPAVPVCLDTCFKASDGVCDDGRTTSPEADMLTRRVVCDLGTDCQDCGPWTPSGDAPWSVNGGPPGPIARLLAKEVEVRVKRSRSKPDFLFAYTSPDADYDVSNHYESGGLVEGSITKIFYQIFKEKCLLPRGKRSLFVDVGGNFGWFSLLAASMGCRVVAFEPVPHFHAFFEYSVHANGLTGLIDIRQVLVSAEGSKNMTMVVPSRGIWGTASIGGANIDQAVVESTNVNISVPSVRLENVVKEDVLLLKVDVEGWEWSVMRGAKQLVKSRKVENIIMEYSPGVPERAHNHDHMKLTVEMLMHMVKDGYRIAHIGDQNKHGSTEWDTALSQMEEVTMGNLVYDRQDINLFQRSVLGCPIPKPLLEFPAWGRYACGMALPEDVSPYSLRAMIGHNTNLWASRGGGLARHLEGTVGIIKLGTQLKDNFFVPPDAPVGMGSRICKDLPVEVQVRHRCHCDKPECAAEEKEVAAQAAAGTIATHYLLPPPKQGVLGMTCECRGAECNC